MFLQAVEFLEVVIACLNNYYHALFRGGQTASHRVQP
jgi:hypothetical protein